MHMSLADTQPLSLMLLCPAHCRIMARGLWRVVWRGGAKLAGGVRGKLAGDAKAAGGYGKVAEDG